MESPGRDSSNPWVQTDLPDGDDAVIELVEEAVETVETDARRTPVTPQPGVVAVAPPGRRLPRVTVADAQPARVWWLGVHGGAGETTLEQVMSGSRAAGHAWPLRASAGPGASAPMPIVVLVARTDANGLRAAQAAAAEWASGEVPVTLLGLVLIADAPGRPPRGLRELAQLVEGGVPRTWHVPWCEAWRQGEPPDAKTAPRAVRILIDAVAELAPPPAAQAATSISQRQEGGAHV